MKLRSFQNMGGKLKTAGQRSNTETDWKNYDRATIRVLDPTKQLNCKN